jgi:hypothetical protein
MPSRVSPTCERNEYAMDPELSVTQWRTELGRLTAQGRRTDDDSRCTLLVINEADGSWSFHGLGAPGVKLSRADATTLAQGIVKAAK